MPPQARPAELIFQLTASSWPFCVTALWSSWAGWHSGCPWAAPAEPPQDLPGWGRCRDFGRSPGVQCCHRVQCHSALSPPWPRSVSSFCTCSGVTMDFTAISCKEHGFGLLKTSWGSEGCNQSDQQAPEVSWGYWG